MLLQAHTPPNIPRRGIRTALLVSCCWLGFSTPAIAQSGTAQLIESFQVRIGEMERLVTQMNGSLEEARYENRQLKERLDRLERELDFRLNALEGGSTQGSLAPPTRAAPPPTAPQPVSPPPTNVLTAPGTATGSLGGATSPPPAAVAPRGDVTLPPGSEESQYNYAFSLLHNRDYSGAEQALRAFLAAHPRGKLAGNAQYWLGETYYARGDYEQAAVTFMNGYRDFPTSTKGPDNLLKLGLSLSRTGKKAEACSAFSRISSQYPSATDATRRRAQAEASNLGCAL